MTTRLPDEVIRVHEKSLRLLDESQQQLKHVSELLRKAVIRLTVAARCDDDKLNQVLDHIKSTVKHDIDLNQLGVYLDKLLVEVDQTDKRLKPASSTNFSICLQQDLGRLEFSPQANQYRKKIQGFIDNGLTDDEISIQLLELVNDIVREVGKGALDNKTELSQVRSFAEQVRTSLALSPDVNADYDVPAILEELSDDITYYAQSKSLPELNDTEKIATHCDSTAKIISEDLMELLNTVNLPESTRKDHQDICRQLDGHLEGAEQWRSLIKNIAALMNKSIGALQDEKKKLQALIKKFTDQLAEIDQHVRTSRQQDIDKVNESTKLKDTVDTNVVAIQDTIEKADNITQLKIDVQDHLSEIRKRVEEHQLTELEREEMSKQGYAHIISELTRTQKETQLLKEQLQESQQKMLRDPLTGLPNRLAYEERITHEINRVARNSAPFCVAMWDVDHFKKVNDTYGHDAGDRVLKLLAKIILDRVRKVDMFARIGGEEFVLLMPDTGVEGALDLNNQLRVNLEDSGFHYKGSPCPITSSVGIAAFEKNDTPERLLNKADDALYKSKREGRNRCTIYADND